MYVYTGAQYSATVRIFRMNDAPGTITIVGSLLTVTYTWGTRPSHWRATYTTVARTRQSITAWGMRVCVHVRILTCGLLVVRVGNSAGYGQRRPVTGSAVCVCRGGGAGRGGVSGLAQPAETTGLVEEGPLLASVFYRDSPLLLIIASERGV